MGGLAYRFKSLFGGRSDRALAPYRARVDAINGMAEALTALSDDDLRRRFTALRERRSGGESGEALMNETFAIVREASARTLKMRHFDEQLLGGMVLFDGGIAEMKTGEGKTLAATLPVCLEALTGGGVHVVTVNDYLAHRDAEWMGAVYRFLGLTVGVNLSALEPADKAAAYACDITYGTNNEFGFDYLRHNMRYSEAAAVQRQLNFAIVDEVDSILIDEARTPLIISGEANDNVDVYHAVAAVAKKFKRADDSGEGGDFTLDEKTRTVHLTETGFDNAEQRFAKSGLLQAGESIYAPNNLPLLHHLDVALRARHLFLRDRDYVVQDGKVVIVDEFTGRLMHGRRWGDNQHQAVEAKEGLQVQKENQTLASISFQNYFRLYNKLGGMTGTALTEAEEFDFIYGLRTVEIPTHQRMVRDDELDKVYRSAEAKGRAVLLDIETAHKRGQPVLVGTTSIEESERLSGVLKKAGLAHNVLNAKQHESEARIIAQAGVAGAVTIATNMAGRGTDIVLGGNPSEQRAQIEADEELADADKQTRLAALTADWEKAHEQVVAAGGLRIIGTERHESRRIDNQLRGRAGRQGDPGSSIFYLSFEDSLLRIFATRHISSLMEKLKLDEDEAIEARMVSKTIENAQRKVESHNFDIRRQLLEYDDIANDQRRLIYDQREEILTTDDIIGVATEIRKEHLQHLADEYMPDGAPEEEWRCAELDRVLAAEYRIHTSVAEWLRDNDRQPREFFIDRLHETAEAQFTEKFAIVDEAQFKPFLRGMVLNIIDDHWRGHLAALDSLRLSIGFRGMAQKNPKQEYKREAFQMFNTLLETIRATITRVLYALTVKRETPPPDTAAVPAVASAAQPGNTPGAAAVPPPPPNETQMADGVTIHRKAPKVRRNDPCPCGSGKKYKRCCGKL